MQKTERWINKLMGFLAEWMFAVITIVWSIAVAMLRVYGSEARCSFMMRLLIAVVMTTSALEILIFMKVMLTFVEGRKLSHQRAKRQFLSIMVTSLAILVLAIILVNKIPCQIRQIGIFAAILAMVVAGSFACLVLRK